MHFHKNRSRVRRGSRWRVFGAWVLLYIPACQKSSPTLHWSLGSSNHSGRVQKPPGAGPRGGQVTGEVPPKGGTKKMFSKNPLGSFALEDAEAKGSAVLQEDMARLKRGLLLGDMHHAALQANPGASRWAARAIVWRKRWGV